jgi:hypothetical protein
LARLPLVLFNPKKRHSIRFIAVDSVSIPYYIV